MTFASDKFEDLKYLIWRKMTKDGQDMGVILRVDNPNTGNKVELTGHQVRPLLEMCNSFQDIYNVFWVDRQLNQFWTFATQLEDFGVLEISEEDHDYIEQQDLRDEDMAEYIDHVFQSKRVGLDDDDIDISRI